MSLISEADLDGNNWLSFKSQPHLKAMFDTLFDEKAKITFVLGAGVSMGSGFPSWSALLTALTEEIEDERLRTLVEVDESENLMRKAETILMLRSPDAIGADEDVFRKALYSLAKPDGVGILAEQVALLHSALGERCEILTTNFDDVMETALEQQRAASGGVGHPVRSFTIGRAPAEVPVVNSIEAWCDQVGSGARSVLHLHGMLRRREACLAPVVLTESKFLAYGSRVQEVLAERLKESTLIFIGVSLSDPNLVTTLFDTHGEQTAYALHVPPVMESASVTESSHFALKKAEYLQSNLHVNSILFKSYSQLNQCLREMLTCLSLGTSYFIEGLRYGTRFRQRLNECYEVLGFTGDTQPSISRQVESAKFLRKQLDDGDTRLGKLLSAPTPAVKRALDEAYRESGVTPDEPESFGIFLWLRVRQPGDGGGSALYAIGLVANSANLYISEFQRTKRIDIEPYSTFPAAQAVYDERTVSTNLPTNSTWSCGMAVPVDVGSSNFDSVSLDDRLLVGAVVLNSDRVLPIDRHPSNGAATRRRAVSLIAAYHAAGAAEELAAALRDSALELLAHGGITNV